ncbi:hypothetical protein M5K25_000563 [Dendrobium thyrsiflorum]|uniref:RRM domain-containing protein n=1 Tax=Dendrobium thyrsiflorum TaxID=117978 RepID=A0ABD0VU58_DENTH
MLRITSCKKLSNLAIPLLRGAKVVTDRATGRSKGYGFVKFRDLNEQPHAMTDMNGAFCSSRPMRIGPASNKNNAGIQQQNPTKEEALQMLNGTPLGGQNIRLSWGRTPANKQSQQEPNQWNCNYYGYSQGYNAYGYAPLQQDPNIYA